MERTLDSREIIERQYKNAQMLLPNMASEELLKVAPVLALMGHPHDNGRPPKATLDLFIKEVRYVAVAAAMITHWKGILTPDQRISLAGRFIQIRQLHENADLLTFKTLEPILREVADKQWVQQNQKEALGMALGAFLNHIDRKMKDKASDGESAASQIDPGKLIKKLQADGLQRLFRIADRCCGEIGEVLWHRMTFYTARSTAGKIGAMGGLTDLFWKSTDAHVREAAIVALHTITSISKLPGNTNGLGAHFASHGRLIPLMCEVLDRETLSDAALARCIGEQPEQYRGKMESLFERFLRRGSIEGIQALLDLKPSFRPSNEELQQKWDDIAELFRAYRTDGEESVRFNRQGPMKPWIIEWAKEHQLLLPSADLRYIEENCCRQSARIRAFCEGSKRVALGFPN